MKTKFTASLIFILFAGMFPFKLSAQWSTIYNYKVWNIAFAPNGDNWIISSQGVVKNLGELTFNSGNSPLPSSNINQVVIDSSNLVWVATSSGLMKYDGSNWTVYNKSNSGIRANSVRCIAIDNENSKWIGTDYGISKFDTAGNWTTYDNSNSGLPSFAVTSIAIDSSGNKWIGCSSGSASTGGLAKFSSSGLWTVYNPNNSSIPYFIIYSVTIDQEQKVWMACHNPNGAYLYGIAVFNGSTFTNYTYSNTSHGLANNWVTDIAIDRDGNKWFSTYGNGLCKFDGVTWKNYTQYNTGLIYNYVDCLGADRKNNCMWAGVNSTISSSGISRVCLSNVGVDENIKTTEEIIFCCNPVSDKLDIKTSRFNNSSSVISIINILGQKAFSQAITVREDHILLDVSTLSRGIYFLQLITESSTSTKRFVKE